MEYRRTLGHYFEWTAGWLLEGGPISRNGPTTQIWAGRSFFDDRFTLGVGAGPYLGFDTSPGNSVTKLNWLVSASASYRFHEHWAIRATFSRVTTTTIAIVTFSCPASHTGFKELLISSAN